MQTLSKAHMGRSYHASNNTICYSSFASHNCPDWKQRKETFARAEKNGQYNPAAIFIVGQAFGNLQKQINTLRCWPN